MKLEKNKIHGTINILCIYEPLLFLYQEFQTSPSSNRTPSDLVLGPFEL